MDVLRRAAAHVLLLQGVLGGVLGGCDADEPSLLEPSRQHEAAPADGPELLELLDPLPHATMRVHYRAVGPDGLEGRLVWEAKQGGYRRTTWSLGFADEALQSEGGATWTPEGAWRWWRHGGAEVVHDEPSARAWGKLREAFSELSDADRRRVRATVARWNAALNAARADALEPTQSIAGVPCRIVRSDDEVRACLWREAGIPLRYEVGKLEVVAVKVEVDVALASDAFAHPDASLPAAEADEPAVLERLARGDWADLPGLTVALGLEGFEVGDQAP